MPTIPRVEAEFYRRLNAFVEPLVRAGVGSPWVLPTGLISLEFAGRRSGASNRIPLVATQVGGHLFVGTLRGRRSQWVRNVSANPAVRYWLRGRAYEGKALVFAPGEPTPNMSQLPTVVRSIADWLNLVIVGADAPFVILAPCS